MIRKFLLSFSLFFLTTNLFAQDKFKGLELELIAQYGEVFKHTPKLNYEVEHRSLGIECNFKFQTFGKRKWHQLQNYPKFGVAFMYYNLGNEEVLGHAYALMPNLNVFLFRKPKSDLHFQLSSGVAYLTEYFDVIENPENNAIGSGINNITALKFGYTRKINSNWSALLVGTFTHYSNGGSQFPNFGINIPGIGLGLKYTPAPIPRNDYIFYEDVTSKRDKKFGLSVHLDIAYRETIIDRGPRYPVYVGSIAATYHLNKVNRLQIGMDYEFNTAVKKFGLHTFVFSNDKEAFKGASRWMIFAGNEFLFGNIGIFLQAGVYVSPNSYLVPFVVYNKLATRYYFPSFGKNKTQLYASILMKSHLINAEYIAFGIGANF